MGRDQGKLHALRSRWAKARDGAVLFDAEHGPDHRDPIAVLAFVFMHPRAFGPGWDHPSVIRILQEQRSAAVSQWWEARRWDRSS